MRTKKDVANEILDLVESIDGHSFSQGADELGNSDMAALELAISLMKEDIKARLSELINDDKDQVVDEKLIGKRLNEVGAILRYFDADYRIVSVDGEGRIITMDCRMWRRNLTVVEDIVTSITYG